VKTTLDLPNDLVREVKLRAVNEGKKLKDVISELLRQGLGQPSRPPDATHARRGNVGIPLFPSSPNAPASRMSLEELVATEHESLTRDDLERIRPST
jgi:plasmid stability protein